MKAFRFSVLFGIALTLLAGGCEIVEEDGEKRERPEQTEPDPEPAEPVQARAFDELLCGSCDNPCPGQPCVPGEAPATLPGQEWFGDFVIADYEYWPYNNGDPSYPDDIGWGYHAGSAPAKKCMAASRAVLVEILQDPPPELIALKDKYGTQGTYAFYNWNNDYTGAADDAMAQKLFRNLWMWEESFIKWISETNRDGRCVLPTREALVDLATSCMTQYPNCTAG